MKNSNEISYIINEVLNNNRRYGTVLGCCQQIVPLFPENSIDCVVTSPPYWQMREYHIDKQFSAYKIGNENRPEEYVEKLVAIFQVVHKLLKPQGSLWLNIGDKYHNKNLMGMPWRVALALQNSGWILRNAVIWEKMKGTQSAKDRLRNIYEFLLWLKKINRFIVNTCKF